MRAMTLLLTMIAMLTFAVPAPYAETQIAAQYDYVTASGTPWAQAFYPDYSIAQTFVATVSGTLESIDAAVERWGDPLGVPISFEIRSVYDSGANGWQPDFGAPPLASGSVSPDDPLLNDSALNWVNVPLTSYELQAGQMYAIVATAHGSGSWESPAYVWIGIGQDDSAYPGGNLLVGDQAWGALASQPWDLPFRVNVVTAPPSVLTISDALVVHHGRTYTVTVQISNQESSTAYDVTVTAATLGASDTNSGLPLLYGAIKPGDSKKSTLQFKAVDSGPRQLVIEGTSSLGDFFRTQTVNVPD